MRDDTPYDQPPAVLARKAACMEWVFRGAPPVDRVLEAFGGLGVTTVAIARRFPRAHIRSVDLDAGCVERARRATVSYVNVRHEQNDALAELSSWDEGGALGVSLDFNRFTLLDLTRRGGWRRQILDSALALSPTWLQLTDTAVGKLHLHWRGYGLEDGDYLTYINTIDRWFRVGEDLRVTRVARRSTSSYLLLERIRDFVSLEWRQGTSAVGGIELLERS
jgi:hypothetical protein